MVHYQNTANKSCGELGTLRSKETINYCLCSLLNFIKHISTQMYVFPLPTASVPKGMAKQEPTGKLKQNKARESVLVFSS